MYHMDSKSSTITLKNYLVLEVLWYLKPYFKGPIKKLLNAEINNTVNYLLYCFFKNTGRGCPLVFYYWTISNSSCIKLIYEAE